MIAGRLVNRFYWIFLFAALHSLAWGADLERQRNVFVEAEKWLQKVDDRHFHALMPELQDYPLYPYLQYRWLEKHLQNTAQIEDFLLKYNDTRYAGILRNKWLHYLGAHKQWRNFLGNYRKTRSTSLQCQYYWAKYQTGHKRAALLAAKRLWVVGRSQPKQCDNLFGTLVKSGYFNKEMVWQRFALALKHGKTGLAKYLLKMLDKQDRKVASFWLEVHNRPQLIDNPEAWHKSYARLGLIYAHGVDRMARSDPLAAIATWDRRKKDFQIPGPRVEELEKRLALALAYRKNKLAYSRLEKLPDDDAKVRDWRVRAALLEGNWQLVLAALKRLTPEEKRQPKWQYWLGRALYATGNAVQAKQVFSELARDRSFHGFLAADYLHLDYQLADRPLQIPQRQLQELADTMAFRMVREFKFQQRDRDARRQWWFAVSKLDKPQLLVAAKLAQRWGWDQIAIFTIARAQYWDDVNLRFPVTYAQEINKNAHERDLDPAIVYGLIRQESAFYPYAHSPVGARGLMQIMPRTGRQIARALKERWRSASSLFDPDVNVKYGTFYYKQMLDRFNGHFALAAAAYNAGPHRVEQWLPDDGPVPADIWIETIPFTETRKYVSLVLSYALIYQQLMGWDTLKMKDLMRDVQPG